MDGFVLDVTGERGGRSVLWIRGRDGAHAVRAPFSPTFYVRGPAGDLPRLARGALDLGAVAAEVVEAVPGLEDAPAKVLRVSVRGFEDVHRLASAIDAWGGHKDLDLYNVDLRPSQRILLARRLFPFARVRAWGSERVTLRPDDAQWAVDYDMPPMRVAFLDAGPDLPRGTLATHDHPVAWAAVAARQDDGAEIEADEGWRVEGREEDVLRALADEVARRDPDVVLTRGGDRFLLPYLRARAERLGLDGWRLGRDDDPTRPARREKSYFTYGKIKYQPAAVRLAGRLHVDMASSFFYTEAGLHGLVDLSRIASIPLAEMARLGAGTAITAIQVDVAAREGRLIPWKKNQAEAFKTARTLLDADRGGYVFEPKVGLHEDVVELDFASLYPNLMVTRNLSPETLLCSCCVARSNTETTEVTEGTTSDPPVRSVSSVFPVAVTGADHLPPRWRVVPQLGYHVCARRGFIARVLEPVIRRRERFKRLRTERPEQRARWQESSDVLKWLLVCSFGYQGYRNARFGRIECHEAICAWGRDVLLETAEIARDRGFELLHGIVDSLWLRRVRKDADAHDLGEAVSRAIGIPFEYQGRYDWIVFLPTRGGNASYSDDAAGPVVGALNRYYGCFDAVPDKPSRSNAGQDPDYLAGGRLKVRGVELRQSSACGVVVRTQERFLSAMAAARDADGFHARLPDGLAAAKAVVDEIARGETPWDDLVITLHVSRELAEYVQMNDGHAALRLLAKHGVRVPAGDAVRYVLLDAGNPDPGRRLVEARLATGREAYDRDAYVRLALRALESLTLPLGYDAARLRTLFQGRPQRTLPAR